MPNGDDDTRREIQPRPYKVGEIVRDYVHRFVGATPNAAFPQALLPLLEKLDSLTQEIEQRDRERRTLGPGAQGGPPVLADCDDPLCVDLQRWRRRLDYYIAKVRDVPSDKTTDRTVVMWEVVAPLFLGFHGGEHGTEIDVQAEIPGGYPEVFNTEAKHGPDLATPFELGNEFAVYDKFEAEQWDLLLEDIVVEAKEVFREIGEGAGKVLDVGIDVLTVVLLGLGVGGGIWLFTRMFRK